MANIYLWSPQCSRRKCIFIHHHTWKQVNLTSTSPKPTPKKCCLGSLHWHPTKLWKCLEKMGKVLNLSRLLLSDHVYPPGLSLTRWQKITILRACPNRKLPLSKQSAPTKITGLSYTFQSPTRLDWPTGPPTQEKEAQISLVIAPGKLPIEFPRATFTRIP